MSFMNNVQSFAMSKKQSNKPPRGQWQVNMLNDDHNTFDHVIDSLMEVCNHSYLQAVQCATIIHRAGTVSVFVDFWEDCESVRQELHSLGLTVTITKYKSYA